MINNFSKSFKSTVPKIIFILIALFFSWLILILRIPYFFRNAIIQVRFGFTIPFIFLLFSSLFLMRIKSKYSNYILFIFITSIYSMALAGMWASGKTEGQIISALLPDTDAAYYYYDGLRIINGFATSFFGARRVFFPALLGQILLLTSNSILGCQIALTMIVAISTFMVTKSIRNHLGSFSASMLFCLLFSFSRLSIGKIMSESIGYSLGCLSFAIILDTIRRKNGFQDFLGFLSLSLGLIIRVGAVSLYPFLLFGLLKNKSSKTQKWKTILLGSLAVVITITSFLILSHFFTPDNGIPFANFSYTLYGLAKGGTGWSSIHIDHPEITSLPQPELTKAIYQLSFISIKENPFDLLKGIFRQFPQIINFPDRKGLFSFVGGENFYIYLVVQIALYCFLLYGIYILVAKKEFHRYQFILFGFIGFILIVPLFPFSDFKEMRVHATVIPYLCILPTIPLAWLPFKKKAFGNSNEIQDPQVLRSIFTSFLLLSILITPILFTKGINKVDDISNKCQNSEQSLYVHLNKTSYIGILPESVFYLDWLPYFHESRFRTNLHNLQSNIVNAFENISAPTFITSTIDLQNGDAAILIFPDEEMAYQDGPIWVCGNWDEYDYSPYNARVFFVSDYEVISQEEL